MKLNTPWMHRIKTVLLFGPTASGKTSLLSSVFCSGYEIVNADSVQVYKDLNIGSAKATEEEQKAVPHHLIDFVPPSEPFSVADFVKLANQKCKEITERGNMPVLSGGTAYYFKNFLYGLPEAPASEPEIREKVENLYQTEGNEYCQNLLKQKDPVSYQRLNMNDTYRVKRALEVYFISGRPLSSFKVPDKIRENLSVLIIGLKRPREELRERIARRVDIMFDSGLEKEIENLKKAGASLEWQSIRGIGYREFFQYPSYNRDQLKDQIILDSIHYAKRQMTFFKSFPDVHWVNPEDTGLVNQLLSDFAQN